MGWDLGTEWIRHLKLPTAQYDLMKFSITERQPKQCTCKMVSKTQIENGPENANWKDTPLLMMLTTSLRLRHMLCRYRQE